LKIRDNQPSNTVMDFYRSTTVGQLQTMVPSINWTSYFHLIFQEFIPLDEPIIVLYASKYMENLDKFIRKFDIRLECEIFVFFVLFEIPFVLEH